MIKELWGIFILGFHEIKIPLINSGDSTRVVQSKGIKNIYMYFNWRIKICLNIGGMYKSCTRESYYIK